MSITLRQLIEDGVAEDEPIPLPNIAAKELQRVIEWCNHFVDDDRVQTIIKKDLVKAQPNAQAAATTEVADPKAELVKSILESEEKKIHQPTTWELEFIEGIGMDLTKKDGSDNLFALIMAVNYLSISPLLELLCRTVANGMLGKTVPEVAVAFGTASDVNDVENIPTDEQLQETIDAEPWLKVE